jgi:NAD(P)-dependent dehydrogenase (short-subunit alcohol dehydrogenase family)
MITGASSGVGFAAAKAFARAGADVALVARGREGLERAAATARECGRHALVLPADVTDQGALDAAVARTEAELGKLDVLVPNAAATIFGRFEDVGKAEFDRVVEATFLGAVNTVRAALPALRRTRGVIVATGSLNARVPLPTWSSYAAAKFAERGFLHTLRLEQQAEATGVRVGIVHPGAIDTPVWETTATATGVLPRRPPEGYRPRVVARALVAMAADPRPEVTIGAEAVVLGALWTHLRPAGDLFWRAVHHYYRSGHREGSEAGALWEAAGRGRETGGLIGRPSLWAPIRMAARPARLGRAGLGLLRK